MKTDAQAHEVRERFTFHTENTTRNDPGAILNEHLQEGSWEVRKLEKRQSRESARKNFQWNFTARLLAALPSSCATLMLVIFFFLSNFTANEKLNTCCCFLKQGSMRILLATLLEKTLTLNLE